MRGLLILVSAALLLTACQSVIPQQRDDEKNFTGTLRVALQAEIGGLSSINTVGYPAGYKDTPIQDRMEAFMEKYPGIQIEVRDINPNVITHRQDLKSILEEKSWVPDIVEMIPNEARSLAADRIVSLAELIENNHMQWEGDYDKVIGLVQLDGEPFLLPVRSDPLLVYYDRMQFRKIGIPEPLDGWTLAEFASAAAKLEEAGMNTLAPSSLEEMEPLVEALGGTYESSGNHLSVGYLDSEATAQAVHSYINMMPSTALRHGSINQQPEELPAMGLVWASRHYKALRSAAGDYAVAPIPSSLEGKHRNIALVSGLAISQESRQQELAWELMKFIMGDSSDTAMDFLADNTLANYRQGYRTEPAAKDNDLKQWMKHEATLAKPATFVMFLSQGGWYGPGFPRLYIGDMNGAVEDVKQSLSLLAQQIDAWDFQYYW